MTTSTSQLSSSADLSVEGITDSKSDFPLFRQFLGCDVLAPWRANYPMLTQVRTTTGSSSFDGSSIHSLQAAEGGAKGFFLYLVPFTLVRRSFGLAEVGSDIVCCFVKRPDVCSISDADSKSGRCWRFCCLSASNKRLSYCQQTIFHGQLILHKQLKVFMSI